jgi:subtilisin family serine protease
MRVLLEVIPPEPALLTFGSADVPGAGDIGFEAWAPDLALDPEFTPVVLPPREDVSQLGAILVTAAAQRAPRPVSTVLVRGELHGAEPAATALALQAERPTVVGVFSDPLVTVGAVCPDDQPIGDADDVARQLRVDLLAQERMEGEGVHVAVVDTGFNVRHLARRGRTNPHDTQHGFTPSGAAGAPGQWPVHHGTMCAFDVGIAAPAATLVDHAVLRSVTPGRTQMEGLLSDAVLSYNSLRRWLEGVPMSQRALVVNNSWGLYSPAWDFPVGHPGNYTDNPRHPFHLIVRTLEQAGADILFAAGNCGRDCPVNRCQFGAATSIVGANSSSAVLTLGAVTVERERLGYSSQGPGRYETRKPDVMAYSHFRGSEVWEADTGTSAACPVAAGVVAALRSRIPAGRLSPFELRQLICRTADDRGGNGYDFDYGWGVIDVEALVPRLQPYLE